jgi:DNA-directed RNA polymerase sigma subunit (sigma70/sigma32)
MPPPAQQTFVLSNLRLVVSVAKKYRASGLPLLAMSKLRNSARDLLTS